MTMRKKNDYISFLEELAEERSDVEWCEHCEQFWFRKEMTFYRGKLICEPCAHYKELCEEEAQAAEDAYWDMWEDGQRGQFFGPWKLN